MSEEIINNKTVDAASANNHLESVPEIRRFKKQSQWKEVYLRMRRNKVAILGLVIFTILVLTAVFAPLIVDYETQVIKQNIAERLQPPSADHWFGTDEFGRDVFARIVYGSRISIFVGIFATLFSMVVGVSLGAVAGYYGGRLENLIMRSMDILLALPGILLAITLVAALGASIPNLILAVAIADIAVFARVVRGSVITIKDQEYIEAARSIGARDFTIITQHILPNCFAPIVVQVAMRVARVIAAIAGLSFIGLGVSPPTPEWGNMLAGARAYIRGQSYLVMFPGVAIMLTILSLNLLGDGLRDALDPRLK